MMSSSSRPQINISELYKKFVVHYYRQGAARSTSTSNNINGNVRNDFDDDENDNEDNNNNINQENDDVIESVVRRGIGGRHLCSGTHFRRQVMHTATATEMGCYPPDDVITARYVRNPIPVSDSDALTSVEDSARARITRRRQQLTIVGQNATSVDADQLNRDARASKLRQQRQQLFRLPRCPTTSRNQLVTSCDGSTTMAGDGGCSMLLDIAPLTTRCRPSAHGWRSQQSVVDGDDSESSATCSSSQDAAFGPTVLTDGNVLGISCMRPVATNAKKALNGRERAASLDSRLPGGPGIAYGSTYGQKFSRACADEPQYNDPMINSFASFQQRIGELVLLEAQTVRWEKTKKAKKKQPRDSL
jgi:hypothetical protein